MTKKIKLNNFKFLIIWKTNLAIDLLPKMLYLDPDRRLTASQALAHPFFAIYHDESDEPIAERFEDPFQDDTRVTLDQLKGNHCIFLTICVFFNLYF